MVFYKQSSVRLDKSLIYQETVSCDNNEICEYIGLQKWTKMLPIVFN